MHPSCLMIGDPGLDGGREGWDPMRAGHARSLCDWQVLSYAVQESRVALGLRVASRETSLLVHGEEVAEAD